MLQKLLIGLLLVIFTKAESQVQHPTYLGEARWVTVQKQLPPDPLQVTEKNYLMTKKVTRDSSRKMFQTKINPNTLILHKGPTIPFIQTLQYTGKKITAPEIIDAPPLQTRDNAAFNISYSNKQHGFAGTNTTGFAEDSNHNIWIASDKGLYRYDGYHYFLYGPKNGVPSMPNLSLLYDNQQRLWLGSDAGVYYIQHDSIFSLKSKEIDFAKVPCFRVQSDTLNRIWLSTKKNGALCIEGSSIQIFDKRCGLPIDYINAVHLSKDGNIYIGLRDMGMIVIGKDKMRWLFSNSKNMNWHSILSFYEDEDGIWAGSFLGGLLRMGKKDTIQYSISGNYRERIFDIKKAPGGGLWIASYSSALCYFNKTDLVIMNETNGLLNRFPFMLFEDSFHNLWVSNLESGFSRVNENSFYIQSYENPAIGFVRRLMPDSKNGKWIITEGRNIQYQKNKETISFTCIDKNNLQPFTYPLDGILTDDGTIWTGSYGPGIVRFDGTTYTAYLYTTFPDNSIVRFVEKDAANNIWFCPTNFGLIKYDNTSFFHYTQESGLLSNTVSKLFLDGNHKTYWTFENGFQRLTNEKVETFFIGTKLFSDQINELFSVDQQTTLLGTNEKGLLIINHNKIYQFTTKDGLASNKIKTIICDGAGKYWISTDKSIESFQLEGINISNHTVFNETNGTFLMEAENVFLDPNGTPYWSIGDKKLVLNPAFLKQNKVPAFSINQVFADNELQKPNTEIAILPNQKININYTAIFWGRENNLAMKYLLISDRGDTSSNVIGDKGHIAISEILPGKYRIILSAQDNNKNYYSTPLFLEIRNFWYNTWVFRISMAIALIAAIIYYYKRKAKRQTDINNLLELRVAEQTEQLLQEKKELLKSYQVIDDQSQEKDVLIQEINHRVKNNLQFISAMIEMQLKKDYSAQTIQALGNTSSRIKAMSLVHEMLYYKKDLQLLSTKKYINELINSLKLMAGETDRLIKFTIDIIDINITSRTGISIGMIISELVINSLKYAFEKNENPEIIVVLSKENETGNIILQIGDNGQGIKGDYESKKGLGSRLVDIFSRQLKGKYTIQSDNQFVYTLIFKSPEI